MTERVNEVDDHLNYLLGRLSLVVQEFNQVRGGLGEALESLRSGLAGSNNSSSKTPSYTVGEDGTSKAGESSPTGDITVITRKEQLADDTSSDE